LIPNATFIAELIIFLVILGAIAKWIVPWVNGQLAARQEAIRQQFQEAEDARTRLEAAEAEYREQIAAARADAARQRDEAREQGQQILADLRAQAQAEAERITKAAQQQIEAERTRTVAALRTEIGTLAAELASRIVGESLVDDARQQRVVDNFLSELEARGSSSPGHAGSAGGSASKIPVGAE
ncbi:MAG: F0F1 ATP synthase subunit B, partial [Gaiellaceae bacterium]